MRSVIVHGPLPSSLTPASAAVNPDAAGFGVYVHWPFCAAKCPYCDFNSHVRAGGVDEERYLAAYRRELRHVRQRIGPRQVSSIFVGGGTPSLMRPATVGGLLDEIAGLWQICAGAEITMESNPSSVERERFCGYRAAGINRVSLGVQALADADLKRLGRLHTADEARAAVAVGASIFERFSFDLIYARMGQSAEAWRTELGEALAMAGGHLSLYQLTIEEGTPFAALHAAGKLRVPDGDHACALFELTQEVTAAHGLPAYEVSNHARPGQECRHNLLYWRYGEFAGVGPGAHGRLILNGVRVACATHRMPERWLEEVERFGHGFASRVALSRGEQADEALLMGLRLEEGLDLERLREIGGAVPPPEAIDELIADGLLARVGGGRIRATARGRVVLDALILRLSAGNAARAEAATAVDSRPPGA